MHTVVKTFGIITIASSLLFGQATTSLAIDGLSDGPSEEAAPLVPVGTEFQVNTYTPDSQFIPEVAMDEEGNFVIVWESYGDASTGQDGDWSGIFAQRYDHSGSPLGVEFQVNTVTTSGQVDPDVAMDSDGNFVAVWESLDDETSAGIFGQRYDQFGNPVGLEFQVNTYTDDWQGAPSVAMSSTGNFVVVWHSWYQDGSSRGVYGQRYNYTGTPQGPEFQINTHTDGHQDYPRIAMNDDGDFVVVWPSDGKDGSQQGISGQRYDHTGNPEGPEFQVNTTTLNSQTGPVVAMDSEGNITVVWTSWHNVNARGEGDKTVFGQRYDFTGTPVGQEFHIASGPDVFGESVVMDNERNAWVTVKDNDQSQAGVFVQGFEPTGALIGTEFRVNTFTTDDQNGSAIAVNHSGTVIVAWSSDGQDGDHFGIFAQRYTTNWAPSCSDATAVPANLFSNDHAFNSIDIANVSDPDGDRVTLTVDTIYQDEAVNAAGSGFTAPDGKGIGTNAAEVRAEHVITGNGRQYRINFTAEDEWGSSCKGAVYVRSNPKPKIDPDYIGHNSTTIPNINGVKKNPTPARPTPPIVNVTQ